MSGAKDQKGDFLCSSDYSFSGVESIFKDKSSSNGKSNDRKSVTSSYTTDDSLSGVESDLSEEELISDEIETRSEKIPEQETSVSEARKVHEEDVTSESPAEKINKGDITIIRSYAPGEEGKFVNFDTVEFAEERAFPHLFPKGDIYLNYFLQIL